MGKTTNDVRKANKDFAWGMTDTGANLILLAVMFGGSAFLLQWGVWFLAVGWAVAAVVRKGADAVDWAEGKVSRIFGRDSETEE